MLKTTGNVSNIPDPANYMIGLIIFYCFIGELTADNKFCSICTLYSIICSIHRNVNNNCGLSSVLPYASAEVFGEKIEELSVSFQINQQEDPSEFLVCLLDHLIKCLTYFESHTNTNSFLTPIQYIFGLEMQSVTKCNVCLNESVSKSWESYLPVCIMSHSSVIEALAAFFSKEELCGDDLYECSCCNKKVTASKTLQIIKTSPVIFIHLKRFYYDIMLKTTHKIGQFITYPEILNLDPYFNENIRESNKENDTLDAFVYQLSGVVVHLGKKATSGHVLTYIRSPDGMWYKFNDELMTSVKLDIVLCDKDAYILCYTKVPKHKLTLSDIEMIKSPAHSSSFVTSSTPIHLREVFDKTINNYTTVGKIFLSINIYNIFMSYLD
jgi:ubiquitin carboxyl-terminal hydrolase 36/42